jgi:hypothetical protein
MRNLLSKSGSRLALTPYLLTGGFFFGKTNTLSLIYNVVSKKTCWGAREVGGASEVYRRRMAAEVALGSHLDLFGGPRGNRTRVSALRVANSVFC